MNDIWYLYMIENRLGHLYTGICKDIERRFEEHQSGSPKGAKALKGKGPLLLRFCAQVPSHGDALRAEMTIKKLSRKRKLALIEGQFTPDFRFQPLDVSGICN